MRVLLVEDDDALALNVAHYLRRAGMAVDVAATAGRAATLMRRIRYDAIVLDLGLPDGDGLGVLGTVSALTPTPRVLVSTARDAVAARVRGLEAGADDYIVKPYALAELVARVRALLRRPAAALASILQVGDLTLDPRTHTAARAGRMIPLTAKEFAVLEAFMRRPGAMLTREDLSTVAWDDSYDPLSNIIDVYIARLRRKLNAPRFASLIETVRGAGYRLRPADPDAAAGSMP